MGVKEVTQRNDSLPVRGVDALAQQRSRCVAQVLLRRNATATLGEEGRGSKI
jgi:hypothetical protein